MGRNISKEKRDALVEALSDLSVYLNSSGEQDQCATHIETIRTAMLELNRTKYGLVFEDHEESIDETIAASVPYLMTVEEGCINNGGVTNYLIEGDNLGALNVLSRTHRGKIDVIYIDPPYNRGKDDFVYDDKMIDENDSYRHSKWLSFMYKRLMAAYELLSDDGVIFISIDDNEQADLKMLADEVFSSSSFVACFPRITKKSGKTTGSFAKNHDYVLVYTKRIADVFVMADHDDPGYKFTDEWADSRGRYKLNQTLDYDSLSYSASLDYELEIDGEVFYPGGSKAAWEKRQSGDHKRADWAWRWSKDLFKFGYENGFVVIKRKDDGTARIYTKTYLNAKIVEDRQTHEYKIEYVKKTKAMSSIELVGNEYSNDSAKKDLK